MYFDKKINKNHIFKNFLVSYFIVLIIPFTIGSFIYYKTIKMVEKDVEISNITLLRQSAQVIDNSFNSINNIVKCLTFNPKVNTFLDMPPLTEGSTDIGKVKDVWDLICSYNYALEDAGVMDLLVNSNGSNITVSNKISYTREAFLYGRMLKYKDMSHKDWKDKIMHGYHVNEFLPSSTVTFFDKDYSVITYLQTLPAYYSKKNSGNIMVLIDSNKINNLLSNLIIGEDGWAYITDKNGKVLTSVAAEGNTFKIVDIDTVEASGVITKKVSGKKMIIFYLTSEVNGWRYIAVLPTKYIFAKVYYIKSITCIITFIALLIGLIIAYYLAYKNTKPIKDIEETVKENLIVRTYDNKNTYDLLKGAFMSLISNNRNLQDIIQEQIVFERAALLRRLLEGHFSSTNEARTFLEHAGMEIEGNNFVVIVLRLDRYDIQRNDNEITKLGTEMAYIKNCLKDYTDIKLYMHDLDESSLAVILAFEDTDTNICCTRIKDFVEYVGNELFSKYAIKVSFGIGCIYKNMLELENSYSEAKQAADYSKLESPESKVWFHDINKNSDNYFYPIDVESKLLNFVKIGQKEKVEKLLYYIYNENFVKRKLSREKIGQFIQCILLSINRLSDSIGFGYEGIKTIREQELTDNIEDIIEKLKNVFLMICDKINYKNHEKEEFLECEIRIFLESNYTDSELCIYSLASKFNYSEEYLYQFFKKKFGLSFADLLEKIRMDNACKLLSRTSLSVEDIAHKVGYNSSHSFRRAFKRCVGLLPTEYKELIHSKVSTIVVEKM
jgi:two-component system, response regulator YesN